MDNVTESDPDSGLGQNEVAAELGQSYEDRASNTDDTLKMIPYEVDHWASKCIRFADEFQTTRSFEDAQSNISDLHECLEEYLKFKDIDGSLRVDILLYCILSNILDGFESNSQIFVNQIPQVSKILVKSLQTSGQLGRYGFQSFKQGVKTIRFLQEFYKKREVVPEKLPIILWQSIKKISLSSDGSTSTPYPTLFPGELHFHLENCPNSSCKTVRIDFSESNNVYLKHSTSTGELWEFLKPVLELEEQSQDIKNNFDNSEITLSLQSTNATTKLSDISFQKLVNCDIDINLSSDKLLISDILQSQPQYSKSIGFAKLNRHGSVVIRFRSKYFNFNEFNSEDLKPTSPSVQYYILGTKQCWQEHSQIILVDNNANQETQKEWLVVDLNGKKVQEAELVENIQNFKWDLKFGSCKPGCWTHPEVLFVDQVGIQPLNEDLSISFESHQCTSDSNVRPKCSDCLLREHGLIFVDQVNVLDVVESVETGVKLDLKLLGLGSGEEFALFKFALSVPVRKRWGLEKFQKEFKLRQGEVGKQKGLFGEEDFGKISKLWEQYKDCYYDRWYPS